MGQVGSFKVQIDGIGELQATKTDNIIAVTIPSNNMLMAEDIARFEAGYNCKLSAITFMQLPSFGAVLVVQFEVYG